MRRTLGELNEQLSTDLAGELANIHKTWWVLPNWFVVLAGICAAASVILLADGTWRLVALLVLIFCATQFTYRQGVHYGFGRGFQAGHNRHADG